MSNGGKFRVLYVSDSLGTPIHPRGIFNYSVSLVEILKSIGASVVLVVERAPGYDVGGRIKKQFSRYSPAAVNSSQIAEIYRYFRENHFSFNWRYPTWYFRILAERLPAIARLLQLLKEKISANRVIFVQNSTDAIDFIPTRGEHLAMMDGFLLKRLIYSASMSRAANNMDPVEINASGYDLVVVDTPHFVKICGIDPRRVLTVVHDLIPLRDPTMGADWRYLFIKKIQASLALDGNLIFASNFTRDTFRANFPDWKTRRELVLYPSIRSSLIRAAASPRRALTLSRPVESPSEPIADKPGDRRGRGLARKLRKAWKMKKLTYPDGRGKTGWDATLPYFATMVSDEPRKNIGILIEAFQKLQGRANMVIMGQVDATRYLRADEVPYIHFAGYVSEADKIEVLRGAAGVIFPSFSEGFGIPLVEGAVVGAPVLCSNIAVFREVAGDHAVYFDPYAPDSLSAAIERVLADPVGCAEMTALLRESAITRFSQAAMAQRLVATLAELGLPTRPATGALAELAGVQEAALGAPRASVANDRG